MTASSSASAWMRISDTMASPTGPKLSVAAYGDSFVGPLFVLKKNTMHIKRFSGSTAKGLQNVNSVSQTGPRLIQSLDGHMPDHVVLIFGHVDLHITYLYKALDAQRTSEKPPEPVAFVQSIFDAYTKFLLDEILPRRKTVSKDGQKAHSGYLQGVHVVSVIMPCVTDEYLDRSAQKYNQKSTEFRKLQGLRLADSVCPTDLATRCKMVADFNNLLKSFCKEHGLHYVDLNKHIAPERGLVYKEYRDVDPSTIHVKWEPTIQFWVKELASTGLSMEDIDPNIDESLVEYELAKMDRMAKTKHRRYASVSEASSPLSRPPHSQTPTPPISSAFTPSPVSVGNQVWRRSHAHSVSTPPSLVKPATATESPGIYRPPHLAAAHGISGGEFGRRRGMTLAPGPTNVEAVDSWRAPGRARAPSESPFGHARHNSVATTSGWGSRR
ncbi:hypothetical protein FS749_016155 [Ceratobasidium sp. UAMH 11750]|nr:hypothetical protein FS749_016155 [Ceratobasidium sp. UAMH 11750]